MQYIEQSSNVRAFLVTNPVYTQRRRERQREAVREQLRKARMTLMLQ